MQSEFSVGDVVQLKSGGPRMTISGIGKYGMGSTRDEALCVWFDGLKKMEERFGLETLSKCKPEVIDAPGPYARRSDAPRGI